MSSFIWTSSPPNLMRLQPQFLGISSNAFLGIFQCLSAIYADGVFEVSAPQPDNVKEQAVLECKNRSYYGKMPAQTPLTSVNDAAPYVACRRDYRNG